MLIRSLEFGRRSVPRVQVIHVGRNGKGEREGGQKGREHKKEGAERRGRLQRYIS